jgi:hypothetical protein
MNTSHHNRRKLAQVSLLGIKRRQVFRSPQWSAAFGDFIRDSLDLDISISEALDLTA